MLSGVEYEKTFITSGPGQKTRCQWVHFIPVSLQTKASTIEDSQLRLKQRAD